MTAADIMDVVTVTIFISMAGAACIVFFNFMSDEGDYDGTSSDAAKPSRDDEAQSKRPVPLSAYGGEADDIGLAQRARKEAP